MKSDGEREGKEEGKTATLLDPQSYTHTTAALPLTRTDHLTGAHTLPERCGWREQRAFVIVHSMNIKKGDAAPREGTEK